MIFEVNLEYLDTCLLKYLIELVDHGFISISVTSILYQEVNDKIQKVVK